MYRQLWDDPRFRPDMVKIYPTLVLPGTRLYELWKRGEYAPYSDEDLVKLLAKWFEFTPPYVRIQRVQREIPLRVAAAGNKIANLREVVENYLKALGSRCRCIRCREVGHRWYKEGKMPKDVVIKKIEYLASSGREIFISAEDENEDVIIAYCRLRIPYKPHREEMEGAAVVRELKVHGPMVEIGKRYVDKWQHKGYGKILMEEAENIAIRFRKERLLVLSGVGAKEYYRKIGYTDYGAYMAKEFS